MNLGDLYTESEQTLQGSFSAVSKPKFASKYMEILEVQEAYAHRNERYPDDESFTVESARNQLIVKMASTSSN